MSQSACLKCGKPVKGEKPVYLVRSPSGRIDGPYHAVCAYFVHLEEGRGDLSATVVSEELVIERARVGETA